MKAAIIVNPVSGGGRSARIWGELRDEVRSRLGGFVEFTTGAPTDATRFAREVASRGDYDLLIVTGGDGTINEVVNGLYNEKNEAINPNMALAIFSGGRGCDFVRSLGVPDDIRKAVDLLQNPSYQNVDVGCCFFKDEFGREQRRFFINIACAGLAGIVAKKCSGAPRIIPPAVVYFGGALSSVLTHKAKRVKVIIDDAQAFEGLALNVFVANGTYSGAGMCWAPMAKIDDGKFEIIVIEAMSRLKLILMSSKIYDGSYLSVPGVHHFSGKSVLIETLDDVYLEMDGEQPGLAPMACSILPGALKLAVGAV